MRTVSTLVAALISTAAAAPAIVWSGDAGTSTRQSSEVIEARALLSSAVGASQESSLSNVVFVVGRDEHGSEGLTGLTASGSLPNVASKYSDAEVVHHYVRGVESVDTLQKDAEAAHPNANVIKSSLSDFKIHHSNKNSASVGADGNVSKSADLIVVNVPADAAPADIDSAVSSAIENSKVGSVVLTSVRGITEVKLERDIQAKQNFYEMQQKQNRRRRLEDADQQDEDANEAIYFVHYTPNIFAGLLFSFFFIVITYVGLGCMDMIAGQDVYVSKYPTIGREV